MKMIPATTKMSPPALAYEYQGGLYLNITSKCPTACEFCIKFSWEYQYRGYNLLLKKEPSVAEVLKAVGDPQKYREVVFCGYGESTYRLDAMKEISAALRARGVRRLRLNTIGLGNLIHKRDIVPDLAEILDEVHVSLNTSDPKRWVETLHPLPEFRETGFEGVREFIRLCAQAIPDTFVTAVETIETDPPAFEALVRSLGARVRRRPYLGEYEER